MYVYKVSNGKAVDYVASRSMNQALMNARAIFGEGSTVTAELASVEETNALLRSHSFPEVE
jgi:hypothetical protein